MRQLCRFIPPGMESFVCEEVLASPGGARMTSSSCLCSLFWLQTALLMACSFSVPSLRIVDQCDGGVLALPGKHIYAILSEGKSREKRARIWKQIQAGPEKSLSQP